MVYGSGWYNGLRRRRKERRHRIATQISSQIYEWMAGNSQIEAFEVTGDLFPRGSLKRKKNNFNFLLIEGRVFTKAVAKKVVVQLMLEYDLRPVRASRQALHDWTEKQAMRLMQIAKRVKNNARVRKCRLKRESRYWWAMSDTIETQPYDAEAWCIRFAIWTVFVIYILCIKFIYVLFYIFGGPCCSGNGANAGGLFEFVFCFLKSYIF